nr:hypothetical protein [Tanacetum cinerariifolium]
LLAQWPEPQDKRRVPAPRRGGAGGGRAAARLGAPPRATQAGGRQRHPHGAQPGGPRVSGPLRPDGLCGARRNLDPTRPVTMALFRPALSKVYENGFAETMDVVGQNYRENELVAAHEAKPARKVIGTENTHVLSAWLALRDKPYMAGQFLWTGFDYLGEGDWPEIANGQGLFDRTGGWRPVAYQRQSWWSSQPVVHVVRKEENAGAGPWVANWTPTDFDTYDDAKVQVYSNCDEVELFLNGKSLGTKAKPADDAPRAWDVTFAKGTLRAVARNKGKEVVTDELKTAGPPARIVLSTDRPRLANSWDDVAY